MARKSWTLLDADKQQYIEKISIGPADVGGAAKGYSVTKTRLRGGLREGVDVIEVDNGRFRFVVVPTRGMGIWKAWLGDMTVGWKSPNRGPVNPAYVPLFAPSGLGWLDGFDELLVRCGLESNGAPEFSEDGKLAYPLHGKIANRPAHYVEVSVDGDTGEITIRGVVDETRFHFAKLRLTTELKTKVGEPGFRIHDTVENLSGKPAGTQMLYHVNFGSPLLEPGSKFVAPLKTVVPRNDHAAEDIKSWQDYPGEKADYEEQVYFMHLLADKQGNTQTLLKDAHGMRGASMYFNVKQLPVYTVWKDTAAAEDGYVTGLEPGTNFPNPRTYEGQQKRVAELAPGGKTSYDLKIEIHDKAADVAKAEKAIAALQSGQKPKVFETPQEGWCAP